MCITRSAEAAIFDSMLLVVEQGMCVGLAVQKALNLEAGQKSLLLHQFALSVASDRH